MTDTKRQRVLKKEFKIDNEWGSRVSHEATSIRFTFAGMEDSPKEYSLGDFTPDILQCFLWHGLSQKGGDSASSPTGTSPEDRLVGFESCMDALIDGVWSEKREGHAVPRTQLFNAICRLTAETVGRELSSEDLKTIGEKVAGMDQDQKKAAQANPAIALHLEAIKEEAKKVRVKKLKEEAKTSDPSEFVFVT